MPKVVKVDPAKEAAKAAAKQEKACNDLIKACKDDALSKAKKGVALLPHPPPLYTLTPHLLPCYTAVESGAELDFDATGTGSTPMHIAAAFGSYEVVNFLFSVGASIEVSTCQPRGPTFRVLTSHRTVHTESQWQEDDAARRGDAGRRG